MKVSDQPFFFKGDHRAVILFHSFTSTPVDFRVIGGALNKQGYTVYAPLLTNHGGNIETTLKIDPSIWFQDGVSAVEKLKVDGYKKFACLGLSLGGIISSKLIQEDNQVIGGGSIASPMIAGYQTHSIEDVWNRYTLQQKQRGESAQDIQLQESHIKKGVDKVLNRLDDYKKALQPNLIHVTKPIFIAQGGNDQVIDPSQAYELKEMYQNAKVSFHWYEEGQHLLTVGKYRKPLTLDLLAFLEQLEWKD